ncbi:MAG: HPr-rel-A system PqqD family peptide chaperone [Methyloprofundus sp.]|nr:HPr-rel-A system PqqD family peptide chaperone [Methyloprofundus sp.]
MSICLWDESAVVYCGLSGQTHILNLLAYEILQLLQESPNSILSLISQLELLFEIDDKAVLETQIQELLSNFESLGLIEVTDSEN